MKTRMSWVCLALAAAAALPISWSAAAPGLEAEKKAIAKVIDDNISWFKDKDFDLLYGTMTNGPDLFMYQLDTKSTIRGFDEFEKYSEGWRNPDLRYGGHQFHDLDIRLSRSGDVAWFATRLEDCAIVRDQPARCFTTRYTGVLEKRKGRWLLVQQHFSLPAEKIAEDWAIRTRHAPGEGGD